MIADMNSKVARRRRGEIRIGGWEKSSLLGEIEEKKSKNSGGWRQEDMYGVGGI